jgi:hypothetical protein
MSFDGCILCVFLIFEGEKFVVGFLLLVESYFEREFLLLMIMCYIMQIFICDHEFYFFLVPHMP